MVICRESTRADMASQSFVKPVLHRFFVILAAVIELFYILVIAQIAAGGYSLWDGFLWLRLVRRRLASHTGFYAPFAAVLCPCKGNEPGLEENLAALTSFDYPNYEIYFSLASSLDPALKVIERIKLTSQHPVHIVIAGAAEDCSEKVFNLRKAVESLSEKIEVLVFTDSDAHRRHHRVPLDHTERKAGFGRVSQRAGIGLECLGGHTAGPRRRKLLLGRGNGHPAAHI